MTAMPETTYTVQTLRSGQPRAYADTEREYLITCKSLVLYGPDAGTTVPWLAYGDVEENIKRDEAARKAATMFGGMAPDVMRKAQRDWAKQIVRALCGPFRERDDEDGRTGMEAHFYPTLKSLVLNAKAGTIRALIVDPYTD